MSVQRVAVVGAGIVGLAVARAVQQRRPGTDVVVLDKEDRVGAHQTGHNSGVVHAGLYYRPGSLKARLCRDGRDRLREYCQERGLPFEESGKLVVAVAPAELGRLDALGRTASANAVPGLRRLDQAGIADVEPYATGLAALHSPRTAITEFPRVARALADDVVAAGGRLRLSSPVTGLAPVGGRWRLEVAGAAEEVADRVVLCAGLQSDRLSRLAGDPGGPRIVPFRGEYLEVDPAERHLVRSMVYPVPDPALPFLGVHLTRHVGGELLIGPTAVLATAREGYRRRDLDLRDVAAVLARPGSWRLARRHWRAGVTEVRDAVAPGRVLAAARRYVPAVGALPLRPHAAGVRAQAVDPDGALVDDFRLRTRDGVVAVRNAPSPGATASLALAELVVDRLVLGS